LLTVGDIRWDSQLTCLETYIRNHAGYTCVANSHEDDIEKNIVKLIRDYNLLKQAKDLVKQLKPVGDALDHLQGDKVNVADACGSWLDLLSDTNLQPHQRAVKKRFEKAIQPMHYFAYKLHPRYRGAKLNEEQQEQARQWIADHRPDLLPVVLCFAAEGEPYPQSYFAPQVISNMDPAGWWKSLQRVTKQKELQELADIMVHLLSCPASSASVERVFSSFGIIHTKLRNRLGFERAAKLVFCYRMLRGKNTDDEY